MIPGSYTDGAESLVTLPPLSEYNDESGASIARTDDANNALASGHIRSAAISEVFDNLPRLACSTCSIAEDCPEFRDGYVCAFDDMFKQLSTRSVENIMPIMQKLVDTNVQRTMQAVLQERLVAGGQLDSRVSAQLNQSLTQLQKLLDMQRATDPNQIRLSVASNGRVAEVNASGPVREGFLSRLFGGGGVEEQDSVEINPPYIDVTDDSNADKK